MLRLSDEHGISLMRISAVDGLDISGLSIPEKDVAKTWDSTLNASFDNRCLANKVMHMTTSEQACAASHLMIWRLISKLRKTLVSTNNVFKLPTVVINEKNTDDAYRDITYGVSATSVKNTNVFQETLLRSRLGNNYDMIRVYDNDNDTFSYHDWYLILEDDAEINFPAHKNNFRSNLGDILRKIPKDADILYLGCVIPRACKKKYSKNRMFVRVTYAWQLHAYILKGSSVEILLKNLPIIGPVDNYMSSLMHRELLIGYSLVDKIVIQAGIIVTLLMISFIINYNLFYRYIIKTTIII